MTRAIKSCGAAKSRGLAGRGFTLVELLVVIAIIGVMLCMALPGVQSMHESARRAACQANLSQLVMAMHGYHEAQTSLPPGVADTQHPIESLPNGRHHGWALYLLPQLDELPAFGIVDWQGSVYDASNRPVALARPEVFVCPTRPELNTTASDYAGCHNDVEAPIDADNHGVLFLNSRVTLDEVTDGRGHTLFVGEKRVEPDDLNWMSGTRATLRNTGRPAWASPAAAVAPPGGPGAAACAGETPAGGAAAGAGHAQPGAGDVGPAGSAASPLYVGPFGSYHAGGVFMAAFGDGAVRPIRDEIDDLLLKRLGNRADGELTPPASQW